MRRTLLMAATLAALTATPTLAETYFGFHVGVSNAPPPPRIYYRYEPRMVYVPQTRVYVVNNPDYDMFRYGGYWYVVNDGYWYRARSYRGPFRVVSARYVPRPIYSVPARHWKHRDWRYRDRDRDRDGWDRDRDRDRGRRGRGYRG